jgi:hypothetical protein
MAADNTAALVVALSAQITKFEKDMKQAVDISKKKTKEIEDNFAGINKAITQQLGTLASNLGGNLGGLGAALTRIGPAGAGVAAALAVVTVGLIKAIDATNKWVEELGRLKDASETLGLTVTQLHALERAGIDTGNSAEQINTFITKFVGGLEKMKDGEGDLFKTLQKLDIELVKQLNGAKTTADAIDILAAAYARLKTESEKVELARAAGGRSGAAVGRLLTEISSVGGFEKLTAQSKNLDEVAKKADAISDSIKKIKKETDEVWGSMFTFEILALQKQEAELMQSLAHWVDEVQRNARKSGFAEWVNTTFSEFLRKMEVTRNFMKQLRMDEAGMVDPKTGKIAGVGGLTGAPSAPIPGVNVPLPPGKPAALKAEQEAKLTNAQDLARLKDLVSVLGDAVTVAEQYRLKRLEIQKLVDAGTFKKGSEEEARAIKAADDAMKASIAATREKLGVSTEQQIITAKVTEATLAAAHANLTEAETQKAVTIAKREALDVIDKMRERQSATPQLQALQNEIARTDKVMDKFAVSSLSNVENAFVDLASQTKTLADAFKAMVDSILKDLIRLLVRKTIIAPLAEMLQGLGAGLGGGTSTGFGFTAQARAMGGPVKAGKLYKVGEQGMEYFIPNSDGQIVPKVEPNLAGLKSSGGEMNLIIENHGADVQQGERKRNTQGGFDLRIAVRSIMQESFADSTMDKSMRRFGAFPRSVSR